MDRIDIKLVLRESSIILVKCTNWYATCHSENVMLLLFNVDHRSLRDVKSGNVTGWQCGNVAGWQCGRMAM